MLKLLLVEDDANLSYIVKCGLEDMIGGYEVVVAADGKEGLKMFWEICPDVVVTDIEMPVMDGYEMVSRIRETDGETPIIFASARVAPKEVTAGYKYGGNNYIKKPFVPEEMDAHIQAMLKMKSGARIKNEMRIYSLGAFVLDADHATVKDPDGVIHKLTSFETQILELLCKNKGEIVKREAILNQLWNEKDDYFASRSLDVFVAKLRKLFVGAPDIEIRTVRGIGLELHILSEE